MPKLILGIGTPGSGKTTTLKPFAQKHSYVYICPDDIRQKLSGNAMDHSRNKEAWDEEVRRRTAEALEQGKDVILDATFARQRERENFIRFARENGADKVQGVFAAVPLETADERNRARERTVPRHAMERMNEMLKNNPPIVEDGFDSVFDINELQELKRAEMRTGDNRRLEKEFKERPR